MLRQFGRTQWCPAQHENWPLQDIVITNILWCMVHTREVGGGSYTAQ